MLKRLIEWFKSLFGKPSGSSNTQTAPASGPSILTSPAPAPASFDFQWHRYKGESLSAAIIHLYARGFVGHLTPAQIEDARAAGVIVSADPKPQEPPVDRSGFALSPEKPLVENLLPNGQERVYSFSGGTRYRIHPVGGDEIHTVNGAPYNSDFIPLTSGSVAIRASGVGHVPGMLRYAVQLYA